MPKSQLNQNFVNSLVPNGTEIIHFDTSLPGFGVRISPKGTKAYIIQRRISGREIKRTIGRTNILKYSEAKNEARSIIGAISQGKDPFSAKQNSVSNFKVLFAQYIDLHAKKLKKSRSVIEDQRLISNHLLPRLRNFSPESISRQDIVELRNDIAMVDIRRRGRRGTCKPQLKGGKVTANRSLALLSKVFNFGKDNGFLIRSDNPVVRIPRYPEHRREEFLSQNDVKRLNRAMLFARINRTESLAALDAIKVLQLTGARASEIRELQWSEVDFKRCIFSKPDTKTGARDIEFCGVVKKLLLRRKKRAAAGEIYVFPGIKGGARISLRKPWERLIANAGLSEKFTLHTLRHTFASQAAMNGVTMHELQKLLGHRSAETTNIYIKIADSASRAAVQKISDILTQK